MSDTSGSARNGRSRGALALTIGGQEFWMPGTAHRGPLFLADFGGERRTAGTFRVTKAVNGRSYAEFTLTDGEPVELTAPLRLFVVGEEREREKPAEWRPQFSGHVVRGRSIDGVYNVRAEGAVELVETTIGPFRAWGVSAPDIVYMLARRSDLDADETSIHGLSDLPVEPFIVDVPIAGVRAMRPASIAGVTILPGEPLRAGFGNADVRETVAGVEQRHGELTAVARVTTVGSVMYDVEADALKRVERALDAIVATSSYGHSQDPLGRWLSFDRIQMVARPNAVPLVVTRGLVSGRFWVRGTSSARSSDGLDLAATIDAWADLLGSHQTDEVARSLHSLREAANPDRDAADRCHALSSALEYYAASSKPPHVVRRNVLTAVKRAVSQVEMSDAERSRVMQTIGGVNNPPLLARVRFQAEQDHVPVSELEWNLVKRLRSYRNDSVHGTAGANPGPSQHEVRWGVSVVSRLLLYRWAHSCEGDREPRA